MTSYSAFGMQLHDKKNSAKRQLRRLRIALIAWIVIFIFIVIWFFVSA